jgi:hypothetical protein
MGMFDQLNSFFSVGNTISQSSNTQPDDVLKTKTALAQTGDYAVPDYGITDIPDMGMIDGLKKFQQKNGLKVDGVMKPGGPTEAKLGETMVNQGISNTDLLESTQPKQKPQPKKIDPLTGLPEVEMPKLKKSKANPWFQSPKIKPVKDEAHSANARTMDGLLQYSKNGSLPALYANSLQNGDEKAVHEYANFMQQLSDQKGDRADEFHEEVVSRLPENVKQVFAQLEMDNDGNETQVGTNTEPQFSERIEEHSAENVQRSEDAVEESPVGEGEQIETESVPRSEDTCIDEELNLWAKDREIEETRSAIRTVDDAIRDVNREISEIKNYKIQNPHPECVKQVPKIKIRKRKSSVSKRGKRIDILIPKPIREWLRIQICSNLKNGETIINKDKAIRELKSHIGELEGVKRDLNRELNGLKQSRRNLSTIYSRCMKKKGKK